MLYLGGIQIVHSFQHSVSLLFNFFEVLFCRFIINLWLKNLYFQNESQSFRLLKSSLFEIALVHGQSMIKTAHSTLKPMKIQIIQVTLNALTMFEWLTCDVLGIFALRAHNSLFYGLVHGLIEVFYFILIEVNWTYFRKRFIIFLFLTIRDLYIIKFTSME